MKKIIQIIPAPEGFYAVYEDEGKETYAKIVCLGLTEDGGVCFMDYDADGIIHIVNEIMNFVRIDGNDA